MDDTSQRIARRIQITGRVQGVSFRAYAKREAISLGLAGWVHNEADGSVVILIEGDADSIDRFVARCQHGPDQAQVSDILITDTELTAIHGFHIVRD